jgi:hypothetical protein
MITFADAALNQLEQVLKSGCVSASEVRIVYDTLPERAICAATVVDGIVWLVVDLDKASANRHALAMFHEIQAICPEVVERARLKGRPVLALVG